MRTNYAIRVIYLPAPTENKFEWAVKMDIDKRVALLEQKASKLIKFSPKPPRHNEVKLMASNDHAELELKISTWLRKARPIIIDTKFVADGAE